jgi:hypothetical protein
MSFLPISALPSYADLPLGGETPAFSVEALQQAVVSAPQDNLFLNPNGTLIGYEGIGLPRDSVTFSPVDSDPDPFIQTVFDPPPVTCWTCVVEHHHRPVVTPEPQYDYLLVLAIGLIAIWRKHATK